MNRFSRRQIVKGIAASVPMVTLLSSPLAARPKPMYSGPVDITTAGGRKVSGILAMPQKVPAPAVLMIHEWWGLNGQIAAEAANYSMMGYIVLAADLYGGQVTDDRGEASKLKDGIDMEAATDTVASWVKWLKDHPNGTGKVGTIGYCFGGGWSLRASIAEPVDATVVFYGDVSRTADELSKLKGPVLGHFATKDKRINREAVAAFEAEMKKAGKTVTPHWYEAEHAFTNYTSERYNDEAAKLSGKRTLGFLKQTLGGHYTREGDLPRAGRH